MGVAGRAQQALSAGHKLKSAVRRRPASLNHPSMRAMRACVIAGGGGKKAAIGCKGTKGSDEDISTWQSKHPKRSFK